MKLGAYKGKVCLATHFTDDESWSISQQIAAKRTSVLCNNQECTRGDKCRFIHRPIGNLPQESDEEEEVVTLEREIVIGEAEKDIAINNEFLLMLMEEEIAMLEDEDNILPEDWVDQPCIVECCN
jgi:hypothetical protein